MDHNVDYDKVAPTYNRRFARGVPEGIAAALEKAAVQVRTERALEVGCGTGQWLETLAATAGGLYGLDPSVGMLAQAQGRSQDLRLVRGRGGRLPFTANTFELVFCVNAIHHFGEPASFINESFRLLRPGGLCSVVGSAPHGQRESWYVYDYFDGVYERDLARFPTWETVRGWMAEAGFDAIEAAVVEEIHDTKVGRAVLDDPFLEKQAVSQLALLSDAAYAEGVGRIEAAVERAERAGQEIRFRSDIVLTMMRARKP